MDPNNEIITALINIEHIPPALQTNQYALKDYTKISYTEISTLGTGLSTLISGFKPLTQAGGSNNEVLYRAFTKEGVPSVLQYQFKDSPGKFVSSYHSGGKIAQTRFQAVTNTSIPYDPTALFMMAALTSINKKLDAIQETQKEIAAFLQDDKRSKLRGNLNFLIDIFNNYKFNWDNATYKTNMHVKVQDVKQDAEQNIDFYRTQIEKRIDKRGLFVADQNVKDKLEKTQTDFKDYQSALYLFGFSSFLEVMLLENFNSEYLDSVANKIIGYSDHYSNLYTSCSNLLEKDFNSSLQTNLLGGLAKVSEKTGNLTSKIPVIRNSGLDKNLINAGNSLENTKTKRIEKSIGLFADSKDNFVRPFIEHINTVNQLYNQPMEFLFDQEGVYLKLTA